MLIKGGLSGKIERKATEPLSELKGGGGNTAHHTTRTLRHTVLTCATHVLQPWDPTAKTKRKRRRRNAKRERAHVCKQQMLIKGELSGKIKGKATEPLRVRFRELKGGGATPHTTPHALCFT